jgi:hypothetical protein
MVKAGATKLTAHPLLAFPELPTPVVNGPTLTRNRAEGAEGEIPCHRKLNTTAVIPLALTLQPASHRA